VVGMRPAVMDRYRRRIARIAAAGVDMAQLPDELVDVLDEAIGFDGICSGSVDPTTLVPTRLGLLGHSHTGLSMLDAFPVSLSPPVHARTRALARAPRPVEILSHAYGGDIERSPLYRHVLAPQGFEHCLRAMLVCDGTCWGFMSLLRTPERPDFSADDVAIAEAVAPALAQALQRSILTHGEPEAPSPDEPGVIVLDRELALIATNEGAQHWLGELPNGPHALPPFIHAVAVVALGHTDGAVGAAPPRVRLRTRTGTWLHVHATALDGAAGRTVAIVIEPARRDHVSPVLAHAYGLTPREREVATLIVEGCNTAEIADRLVIARYTVQDHLKAVFDKVGVRSRHDLVRALCSPATPDAVPTPATQFAE
jgi:DNA-binding CsgD family transcriptional regulator